MGKYKERAKILSQEMLVSQIYEMWVETEAAEEAVPGQFVSLFCQQGGRLLPRPISICEIDRQRMALRLVYRIAGKGTTEISQMPTGSSVELMGPLGNGFPLEGKRPILIGGGIGIPPMLELAKELNQKLTNANEKLTIVLGYRNRDLFLLEQFEEQGNVVIATDDGSVGCHGTVVDAMREQAITGDVIYACGPRPMLAAVRDYAVEHVIRCYISMEERMACGIGACLGCVCTTKEVDSHSQVNNARVCKDGPVFLAEEVEL